MHLALSPLSVALIASAGGATYAPVVQNDHIHLAKIALGNDDGREVEIANGLSSGDLIAVNVGEGVEEGDPVQPVMPGRRGTYQLAFEPSMQSNNRED
jgi:hypothetical protein